MMNNKINMIMFYYNNLDIINPLSKIALDSETSARNIWRHMQETEWTNGNKEAIVFYLRRYCDQYLESLKKDNED